MKTAGVVAAGGALVGVSPPKVHAGEDNTIRLALVGCGGRGGGAVGNALSVPNESVQLHAMADLYQDKIDRSHNALNGRYGDKVNVTDDRKFVGFDAYRRAIDTLRPGDVVILTTRSNYRPIHLAYAVEKGVNVFMEKPFAPDPGGLKQMLAIGKVADEKNLKIGAGLMCRHSPSRQALIERIREGDLGDILMMRAYRLSGGSSMGRRPANKNELEWQLRNGKFLWISSGRYVEWMIHQIDECCWIKDAWPVEAIGISGRYAGSPDCSQDLDTYAVEYTWADGAKALVELRTINQCVSDFATYVHGTKRAAQFSGHVHRNAARTYNDQRIVNNNIDWQADREQYPLHQYEWHVLLDAIRNDRQHNETERAVHADYASVMGRAAAHSGQRITWDAVLASDFQYCDNVASLDYDSEAPVHDDAEGRYPAPVPGVWTEV